MRMLLRAAAAVMLLFVTTAAYAGRNEARADPVDWNAIAQCESGGDWSADTGNGYYGGLQISRATWLANGGVGSPADAPPQEQIAVANRIFASQGPGAWPTCAASSGAPVTGSLPNLLTQLQKVVKIPCLIPIQCF